MRLDRRALLGLTLTALADVPAHPLQAKERRKTTPAAAPPPRQAGAVVNVVLEAGAAESPLSSAAPTATWAFGGTVPGPLIRVKQHTALNVRLVNRLTQPTSLHWHGLRIANAMDGAANLTQAPVAPGQSFDYRFAASDAGTFWYHPDIVPFAAEQVGRGLYGVLIVDEPEPPPVDDDLLVVLDDWRLDGTGEIAPDFLNQSDAAGSGRIGGLVTVNSKPAPMNVTCAPGARLRLRLLNAANARVMVLDFGELRPRIIAIDGQPCDPFEPVHRTIPIGPGARFEIVLDAPRDAGAEARVRLHEAQGEARDMLVLSVQGTAVVERPAFPGLPGNPALPAEIQLQNARRFDVVIAAAAGPAFWSINGRAAATETANPAFTVRRGTPVVIGFTNQSDVLQTMHVHGHVMRLLHDLDDGWEPFWRDSVVIEPSKTHHAAFVADNPGKWLIRSAILDYAMTGASLWFEVT